jgi:hypothetical protein
MSRRGGDSYYVLVNNQDEVYEQEDNLGFTYTVECDSWEEAEDTLQMLIADEELDPNDGWHVERHRW